MERNIAMDELIKDLANRIISSIHDQLFKVFDFFKIENVMPLYLNKGQLEKMLNLDRDTISTLVELDDFPKLERKGKRTRFPRDPIVEWVAKNQRKIETLIK